MITLLFVILLALGISMPTWLTVIAWIVVGLEVAALAAGLVITCGSVVGMAIDNFTSKRKARKAVKNSVVEATVVTAPLGAVKLVDGIVIG